MSTNPREEVIRAYPKGVTESLTVERDRLSVAKVGFSLAATFGRNGFSRNPPTSVGGVQCHHLQQYREEDRMV